MDEELLKNIRSKPWQKLKKKVKDLVILWDPIGVFTTDENWPKDEYDAYVWPLCRMILENKSADEIACALDSFSEQNMGLSPSRERNLKIAKQLAKIKP
jgi:hypothetical protein